LADENLRLRAEAILSLLAPIHPEQLPALDYGSPFELLVATVLSAPCTDARVNTVTPALFARFPDPRSLAEAARDDGARSELENARTLTGFFRAKARNLSLLAVSLVENFGGNVPSTMEELTSLPGVGRKDRRGHPIGLLRQPRDHRGYAFRPGRAKARPRLLHRPGQARSRNRRVSSPGPLDRSAGGS
jgi:hypothetical protein